MLGHVATKFTSTCFDKYSGKLYTGCHALKVWKAEEDGKVKIKALQVETLSKALLKERQILTDAENKQAICEGEDNENNSNGIVV